MDLNRWFLPTCRRSRRRAASGILLAAMLGAAVLASGQEQTGPPPVAAPTVDPSQPQPATPELSKKQRKQLQRQQLAASGGDPAGPSMKDIFAGTIAAVIQASGGALLGGVAQVVTGGLLNWFTQKVAGGGSAASEVAAGPPPDAQATAPPSDPVQPFPVDIAAGLAFEVHRLDPGGATTLVDPAVHAFRTGERFVVFFRPSLPGRMDIYNINPTGQQILIDTQELAAGQLTQLGPYEFTAATGDEQLRLVMQPCSTPQLVSATRDIVRVPDTVPAQGGMVLQACNVSATRSARAVPTRDIRKVTVEDGTRFALDPISEEELASGQLAPREVTIRFRHL